MRGNRLPGGTMNEKIFSSHAVGELLQANPSTVIRWIDSGQLKAYRTPGGHRRVRERDLLSFLHTFKIPIPKALGSAEAGRFLVVDGDTKLLRSLKRGIAKHFTGAEVETCQNGIEALLRIGTWKPDVVVLDFTMHDFNAIEVCRRIKSNPETSDIVVLAMTAKPGTEIERKAAEAGAKGLLPKPVSAAQVAQVLLR
jgi:excisionase family DNA binding protein